MSIPPSYPPGYLVRTVVVRLRREEGVPAHAGGDGGVVGRALRVLCSFVGAGAVVVAVGGAAAAVDVDHVAVLDGHRVHALLVPLPAQDLGREGKWGMNALKGALI